MCVRIKLTNEQNESWEIGFDTIQEEWGHCDGEVYCNRPYPHEDVVYRTKCGYDEINYSSGCEHTDCAIHVPEKDLGADEPEEGVASTILNMLCWIIVILFPPFWFLFLFASQKSKLTNKERRLICARLREMQHYGTYGGIKAEQLMHHKNTYSH